MPPNPGAMTLNPVTFPPGRARLATSPVSIGAALTAMTIGIVLVASFAAWAAEVASVTSRSTLSRTSSAASATNHSGFPAAKRYSRMMFFPST